ncbi:hypothetical protein ACTFIZ_000411 [Dictyostelium cf. discoideum]
MYHFIKTKTITLIIIFLFSINFIKSEQNEKPKSFKSIYSSYLLNNSNNNNNENENLIKQTKIKSSIKELSVGIIGAGICGLYSAMILQDLGINYKILEINKERIGGRIYSYRFSDQVNDFSELGAMRIPIIPIMDRLVSNESWSLFSKLLKSGHPIKTYPFILSSNNSITYYNGKRVYSTIPSSSSSLSTNPMSGDPFHFSDSKNGGKGMGIPDEYAQKPYGDLTKSLITPFIKNLTIDFDNAFKSILKIDNYSTREYLKKFGNLPNSVINYLETLSGNTGQYENSYVESILSTFDFSGKDWIGIEGGTDNLIKSISKILKNKIEMGQEVIKISKSLDHNGDINGLIVDVLNEHSSTSSNNKNSSSSFLSSSSSSSSSSTTINKNQFNFKHVISTTTLSALQRIDTSDLNLSLKQRLGIRSLHYSVAIKIAIKFKFRWWEDFQFMKGKPIKGGRSSTDLPIRSIIYPSYGIGKNSSGVLLASYVGGQDALRLGSLVGSVEKEKRLIRLCLENLAEIHDIDVNILRKLYKTHKCMHWSNDENASGAYGLYWPSQFLEYYPSLTKPSTDGRFHISGESTSIHHAWIIGALNSAYRSVDRILRQENLLQLRSKLIENWGIIEKVEDPSLPLNWFENDNFNDNLFNNNSNINNNNNNNINNNNNDNYIFSDFKH